MVWTILHFFAFFELGLVSSSPSAPVPEHWQHLASAHSEAESEIVYVNPPSPYMPVAHEERPLTCEVGVFRGL